MSDRDDAELGSLWNEFHTLVNMPSPELRDWLLNTPDGVDSYLSEPGVEPHALGEQVLQILEKRRGDLTDADIATMRRVNVEIGEMLANAPADDVNNGPWRDSLRTLGHDPTRSDSPRGPDLET